MSADIATLQKTCCSGTGDCRRSAPPALDRACALRDREAPKSDVGAARHRFIARWAIPTPDPRGDGQFSEGELIAFPGVEPPVKSTTSKRVFRHSFRNECARNVKFSQEMAGDSAFRARDFIAGKDSLTLVRDIEALDAESCSAALKKSPMKRARGRRGAVRQHRRRCVRERTRRDSDRAVQDGSDLPPETVPNLRGRRVSDARILRMVQRAALVGTAGQPSASGTRGAVCTRHAAQAELLAVD